ncbi:MAG: hypothetical protein ACJ8AO_14550 [Gemmatimonadaceae bacterium]
MTGMNARTAARRARFAALALAASLAAAPAGAQAPTADPATGLPLAEGTRVRVRATNVNRGRRIEGSVFHLIVDTVVVDTAPEWRTHRIFGASTIPLDSLRRVPVPVRDIQELQVGMGPSRFVSVRRNVIRGAIVGALVGGLANTPQRNPSLRDVEEGAAVGLPIGAGLGFLWGIAFPSDRWRTIPLPSRPVAPAR